MGNITVDCKRLNGEVRVPVSKSILHRYLICSFLNDDYDALRNVESIAGTLSDDVRATRDCLLQLVDTEEKEDVLTLRCGESGTTLRFLTAIVAALGRKADFIAEGTLVGRPMKEFIDELNQHGADITASVSEDGKQAVYSIRGKLTDGDYILPGNISSQYVSAMILAADLIDGDAWIMIEDNLQSASYVDMTEAVIRAFDMDRGESVIEGDWSSGAMWVVANDLLGGKLKVTGLQANSIQGDSRIIDILNDYAVRETMMELEAEEYPDDKVYAAEVSIDVSDCPDLVPAIALRATMSPLITELTNAKRLKLKESNRLQGTKDILMALGADIRIGADGESLRIKGTSGAKLPGSDALIDTYGDHRMVILAAMASIVTEQPVNLSGMEAVSKSYPEFFEVIRKLGGIVE